jgi:hypothetical protein
MELLGVVMRAPALLQQAAQRVAEAPTQHASSGRAELMLTLAASQIAGCCRVHTIILLAAMDTVLVEADAMRLAAAAAAPLQAAPDAPGLLRCRLAGGNGLGALNAPEAERLLGHSSNAILCLLKWLALPAVPPRVRQLAERRTVTAPTLLSWLRIAAETAQLLVQRGTGD